MKPVTQPGAYAMRDANGYTRFPELVRAAEIGLRTVRHERDRGLDASREPPQVGFEL